MKNFICKTCNKEFFGYGNRKTCSKECQRKYYNQQFIGKNNPNFRYGDHCYTKHCPKCGIEIDYRANECKECAGLLLSITEEDARKAAKETNSYLLMGQYLDVSRQTAKRLVKEFNIDISHFKPGRGRKLKTEDVLVNGKQARNSTVYRCIVEHDLLPLKCAECGTGKKWNGKLIRLNLHHINGNNKDNRIENLQILCPNCHSQTDSFTGRNIRKNNE